MSDRPAGSNNELSSPAPYLFLVLDAPSVCLGPTIQIFRVATANSLAQPFQPHTCPSEFDTQNCEPHGNYDDRRARGDNHHNTYQQHCHADNADDDAARSLVGEVHHSLDQDLPHRTLMPLPCRSRRYESASAKGIRNLRQTGIDSETRQSFSTRRWPHGHRSSRTGDSQSPAGHQSKPGYHSPCEVARDSHRTLRLTRP